MMSQSEFRPPHGNRHRCPEKSIGAAQRQREPDLVTAVRDGFSVAERLSNPEPLGEASTGAVLIDRVLYSLGYWPFIKEIQEDHKRVDYMMPIAGSVWK
jgi:hypothetical protein